MVWPLHSFSACNKNKKTLRSRNVAPAMVRKAESKSSKRTVSRASKKSTPQTRDGKSQRTKDDVVQTSSAGAAGAAAETKQPVKKTVNNTGARPKSNKKGASTTKKTEKDIVKQRKGRKLIDDDAPAASHEDAKTKLPKKSQKKKKTKARPNSDQASSNHLAEPLVPVLKSSGCTEINYSKPQLQIEIYIMETARLIHSCHGPNQQRLQHQLKRAISLYHGEEKMLDVSYLTPLLSLDMSLMHNIARIMCEHFVAVALRRIASTVFTKNKGLTKIGEVRTVAQRFVDRQ